MFRPVEKSRTTIFWSCEVLREHGKVRISSSSFRNQGIEYTPDDPCDIELDVEYMTGMSLLAFEFANQFPVAKVPKFDGLIVTGTDKTTATRIKREGTDKGFMSDEGP